MPFQTLSPTTLLAPVPAVLVSCQGIREEDRPNLLAVACPVIANGVIVGLMLSIVYALPAALTMLQVAAGEALAVLVGCVLLPLLRKTGIHNLVPNS